MVEVLAPCGSIESLYAAIYSKADAVYFGLSRFNARIKANNFTKENVKEYVDLCHIFGIKVYITFNTLILDSEFEDFEQEVKACVDAAVDAFIVTDLGTLSVFRKYNIPLHASTQMGIHNLNGALIAEQLGFTRVVLSREALEKDIIDIKTHTNLEIEYFVHGALCVSFSGGCYLSSLKDSNSGNRGLCKQPCRFKYTSSISGASRYYLSPADQCLIENVQHLVNIGVCSLKIEGRLKQPYYVGEVVKQYKKAVEGKLESNYKSRLFRVYNRGNFTSGYNYDGTLKLMSPNIQGNMGEFVGVIVKTKGNTLYIKANYEIQLKDAFKIIFNNNEVGGFQVDNVKKENGLFLINTLKSYPVKSNLYITQDSSIINEYTNLELNTEIRINCKCIVGEPLEIEFIKDNISAKIISDIVEVSQNRPITKENIMDKLGKLGGTLFYSNDININVSDNAFVPISKINNLKRDLIEKLKSEIITNYNKNKQITKNNDNQIIFKNHITNSNILVEIDDLDKATQFMIKNCKLVLNITDYSIENIVNILKNKLIHNNIDKVCLKLPKICRNKDLQVIEDLISKLTDHIDSLLVENIYGLELCLKFGLYPIGGVGLNIFNLRASKYIGLTDFVCSIELDSKNIFNINNQQNGYVYSYGQFESMTFTHCPYQLNTNCTCANCKYAGDFTYTSNSDVFTVSRRKISNCYFVMYYSKIIDLRDSINKTSLNKYYINFVGLDNVNYDKVIRDFINKSGKSDLNSTLGHFNNIVL